MAGAGLATYGSIFLEKANWFGNWVTGVGPWRRWFLLFVFSCGFADFWPSLRSPVCYLAWA